MTAQPHHSTDKLKAFAWDLLESLWTAEHNMDVLFYWISW